MGIATWTLCIFRFNFLKVKVFLLKIDFHKGLYGRLRRRARDKARRARYSSQPSVTTHGLGIAGPDITITITIIMTITTTIITITTKITITTHSLRITRPDINFLSSSMKFWPLKTSPKITKYFSRNNQICSQFNKITIISELNVPLKFYLHFFVLSKKINKFNMVPMVISSVLAITDRPDESFLCGGKNHRNPDKWHCSDSSR